jgi:hypothetical protein
MLRPSKMIAIAIAAIGVLICGAHPASAGCQVISATHSAYTQAGALQSSQLLAAQNALELKRQNGWRSYSMRARRVIPDPFWKAVRPVVPAEAMVDAPLLRHRPTRFAGRVSWFPMYVPRAPSSALTDLDVAQAS